MTSRPKKSHPACLSGLVATAVLMGLAGILFATELLAFDKPWWLLTWPVATAITWMLDRTGRAGLPPRTRASAAVLRHGALAGICLALAEPQAVRISDRVAVLYLLDHSASIPDDVRDDMLAYVNAAGDTKREKDIAGLVVFGSQASMEVLPTDRLNVSKIYSFVKPDYTDAESALTLAAAAFPTDARKKIVLLSDGNENKGSMLEGARFAAGNDVVVDTLPVSYRYGDEILIDKVRLPERIREG